VIRVPLLDLRAQYASIRDEIRAAIDRVCESQQFILGPEVEAFEREAAAFLGARHAVGVSSGTDALLAALWALGVGPGDEVIVPAYTFFATAGAPVRLGARPVFVDVEPEGLNLDGAQVRARLTSRTKAIIPVHLFGRPADLEPLLGLGVPVVEDAAQAIGARDAGGRAAGTIGRAGCFSFFPSKNLGGFGDGGMVVTDDAGLAERMRILRVHGMNPKYHHREVGGNFRLDALQAAVLRVKLRHLSRWTQARRDRAERYRRFFREAGLEGRVRLPADAPGHVYHQFVIRVPDRDGLRAHLERSGIGTEIYYPVPLPHQECFAGLGHRPGEFPVSEAAARESLALPMYPELTEEQQRAVVAAVGEYYGA
jgi:dTDP-4-amino-4,6-dideoxygalactose transaminase